MNYKNTQIYQIGTMNSLINGVLEGDVTLKRLAQKGDFGIGTYNHVAGEMILLDKTFYQIGKEGIVRRASQSIKTPFAVVTFFHKKQVYRTYHKHTLKQLKAFIDTKIISKNLIYAIKIIGDFSKVQMRAMKTQKHSCHSLKQEKNQYQYSLNSSKGTLVGFWFPQFMNNINVPGYHFHFLDMDKKRGGHLFNCISHASRIEISTAYNFHLELFQTTKFLQANLIASKIKEIKKLEKGN